jgi:uncharacterized protein YndB with AHSA1/START domain
MEFAPGKSLRGVGLVAGVMLCLPAHPTVAAELLSLHVSNQDDLFVLESESLLQASPRSLFQVLMDYDHFTELSSAYTESRHLGLGPDGAPRVYTLASGCMLFVCRSVEKVERLETVPGQRIVATVIPELSNLQQGITEWVLTPDKGGTRLFYRMELVPRFWVPPLIGPPIIRYVLEKGGKEALQNLEDIARQRDLSQRRVGS